MRCMSPPGTTASPSGAVMIPPMWMAQAPFLRYATALRARVKVPVIAVGRLGDPALAAAALAEGKADFIALGRSLVADPDWVNKVAAGVPVRRCLSCNTCVDEMRTGARIGCVVNAAAGRERELGDVAARRDDRRDRRRPGGPDLRTLGRTGQQRHRV